MYQNATRGIAVPEILIPNETIDMNRWAVVACDQFTANHGYWDETERIVNGAPSALHLILPEIYLNAPDKDERIDFCKESMYRYINEGILAMLPEGFVLVQRSIGGATRKGLLVALDLEEFDFDPAGKTLIRSSEQTVLDRIPPRMAIRAGAPIELPHILVMIDDPNKTVIEPLAARSAELEKLYDFELMQGGGRIAGYFISDGEMIDRALSALDALPLRDGMRYCVGDGNHSLVTAKFVWENAKASLSAEEQATSPLRYALVELINLRDEGVTFLPIHRILYKVNVTQCVQYIVDKLNQGERRAKLVYTSRRRNITDNDNPGVIPFISKSGAGRIELSGYNGILTELLQPILEEFVKQGKQSSIEYVHTTEECLSAAEEYDTLSILMSSLPKSALFDTVATKGVLPKKSFSLGEAEQKRYYLECRLIAEPKEPEIEEIEPQDEADAESAELAPAYDDLEYDELAEYTDMEYETDEYADDAEAAEPTLQADGEAPAARDAGEDD